ncbi:hypothetical protein KDK77_08185 [bacterium]|nr:hypothetical protein [bacterium]
MQSIKLYILITACIILFGGCASSKKTSLFYKPQLIEVAQLTHQPTGIAVSQKGRIFINFPRWNTAHEYSVAELSNDGSLHPYPDEEWNWWEPETSLNSKKHFVCVQSVYCDNDGHLWILDPAQSLFITGISEPAKLVKVDLATDQVMDIFYFDSSIAPSGSYLNDIRIDTTDNFAYITDSGLGAIIVLDIKKRSARRILSNHPSTKAEPQTTITINSVPLQGTDGKTPQIHADAIALDTKNEYLYYQALTGKTLYRFNTSYLKDATVHDLEYELRARPYAKNSIVDGITMDHNGNMYLTSLEQNAIVRFNEEKTITQILIQDTRISWPDSVCIGPDGFLYFTASQIHLMPQFNNGADKRTVPYYVFKIDIKRYLK